MTSERPVVISEESFWSLYNILLEFVSSASACKQARDHFSNWIADMMKNNPDLLKTEQERSDDE